MLISPAVAWLWVDFWDPIGRTPSKSEQAPKILHHVRYVKEESSDSMSGTAAMLTAADVKRFGIE
jgi:hypothetical protein